MILNWLAYQNTVISYFKRTLKTYFFAEYQQCQLETLQHVWYVCIQVALIKKSILIISYHDVKMVSWIRLNDSVTTAFF